MVQLYSAAFLMPVAKVFDLVDHNILFCVLMDRNTCPSAVVVLVQLTANVCALAWIFYWFFWGVKCVLARKYSFTLLLVIWVGCNYVCGVIMNTFNHGTCTLTLPSVCVHNCPFRFPRHHSLWTIISSTATCPLPPPDMSMCCDGTYVYHACVLCWYSPPLPPSPPMCMYMCIYASVCVHEYV